MVVPFSLHCTTCQRALRVTDAAAIGQILPCPKCGSMVHIVPPLEDAAPVSNAMPTATVSTAVVSSPLRENDLEQFAADEASLISDGAPAAPIGPPPLPRAFSAPVDAPAPVSRSGVLLAVGAVAAAVTIGVISWGVVFYLDDDTAPAVAISHDAPVQNKQEPGDNQPLSSDDAGASGSPGSPVPQTDEPAADPIAQADSVSQATEAAPPSESDDAEGGLITDAAVGQPPSGDGAITDESESPIAKPDARTNPVVAGEQHFVDPPAPKPALKLEELPRSELPLSDPVAEQSAGLEAGQEAGTEAPRDQHKQADPPVEHTIGNEDDNPAEATLRRIAPDNVDVPARLATQIATIQFRDAPLHKTVNSMAELAGVPIGLDVDALRAAGVRVERPMTFVAKSVTIAGALAQGLRPLGLEAREQNGTLQVLPVDAGRARKARYAVDDLVRSGDPPIEDLVDIVRTVVRGRAIAEDGNSLAVTAENGAIYLTAREIEHDRMIELCEKLRVARGRPLRTRFDANRPDPRFDPRRFELATRRTKAADVLAKPVTVGVGRPAPLCDVVDFLAAQTGATILVDQAALARAGLAVQTEARLAAAGEPLESALGRLLAPLDLAFRVVDGSVLEITTTDAVAKRACIEFYPLRGLGGGALAAEDLTAYRGKLLAAAGIADSKAAVEFDSSSEYLIVCASYPEHVLLEEAMRKLARP
jgi:hypothetical protein